MGRQVFPWEISHSVPVLQHLIPSPGCDNGSSGSSPPGQKGAGGLREGSTRSLAGECANSQHHSLSFLSCGNLNLNKQHTWRFGEWHHFPSYLY